MGKFAQTYFGIPIFILILYTPIYVLFFDSVESAVKSTSLQDLAVCMMSGGITGEDIKIRKKQAEELMEKARDHCKKNTGIDISDSIYSILKDRKDVKDVSISKEKSLSFRDGDGTIASIRCKLNNKESSLAFYVLNPSFIRFRGAKVLGSEADSGSDIAALAILYGLSDEDAQSFARMVMSNTVRLPNN